MNKNKYSELRSKLREYKMLESEIKYRTKYIENLKETLIKPLPNTEKTLRKIYKRIIDDLYDKVNILEKKLKLLDSIIDKLDGNQRNVIYYRYVLGINWISIPDYMMYEQRTCQFYEEKALREIEKMNIDWENGYVE